MDPAHFPASVCLAPVAGALSQQPRRMWVGGVLIGRASRRERAGGVDWSETSSQLGAGPGWSSLAQGGEARGGRPRPCGGPGRREGGGAGAGEVWAGQVSGPDGDGAWGRGGGTPAGPAVWVGGSRERPWAAAPIRPADLRGRPGPAEPVPVRGARPVSGLSARPPNCLFSPLIPVEASARPVK